MRPRRPGRDAPSYAAGSVLVPTAAPRGWGFVYHRKDARCLRPQDPKGEAAGGPVNWPGYKCQCPWISPSGTPPCLQGACPGYPGWGREDRQPSDMGPVSCAGVQITVGRGLSPLGRHPDCRERARSNRGGERRRSASPAYGQALPRGPRPVALTTPGSRCGCVRRTLSLWVFSTLGDELCLDVDASAPSLGGLPEVTYRVPGQLIRTSWICCGQPAYTYLEASGFGARRALNFVIAWTQTPL